jgi:hypothetical protein
LGKDAFISSEPSNGPNNNFAIVLFAGLVIVALAFIAHQNSGWFKWSDKKNETGKLDTNLTKSGDEEQDIDTKPIIKKRGIPNQAKREESKKQVGYHFASGRVLKYLQDSSVTGLYGVIIYYFNQGERTSATTDMGGDYSIRLPMNSGDNIDCKIQINYKYQSLPVRQVTISCNQDKITDINF